MTHTRLRLFAAAVLAVVLAASAACGSSRDNTSGNDGAPDSASLNGKAASPSAANSATTSAEPDAQSDASSDSARVVDSIVAAIRACPRDGTWHPCSIERRLQMSGFRTVLQDSVTRIPGITRDGTLWLLGRQSLHVVFFASAEAADSAMRTLDSARAAPRGDTASVWEDRPTLLRSANALAVFVGASDRTIERVANAITAGPPQPDRATP